MNPRDMRSAAPSRQRNHCLMRESHGRNSIPDPEMSLLNIRFWARAPENSLLWSFDSRARIPSYLRTNQRDMHSAGLWRPRNYCHRFYSHVYTPNRIERRSPKDRHSPEALWQCTRPRPVENPACIPIQSRTVLIVHLRNICDAGSETTINP